MYEIAADVYLLKGVPNYLVNQYLVGDVLVDAGTKLATNGIMRQLRGKKINAHALTHVHPDHQGASHHVCSALDIPLWCGAKEIEAMETGDMSKQIPRNTITNIQDVFWTGTGHPVARGLHEGDEVNGFIVLDAPGHSPGQIVYWREKDKLLIIGDVLNNISFTTLQEGLHEPPTTFTLDSAQNRKSAHKLAQLNPKIVCFGHGKPLFDSQKIQRFVETLAQ